MNTLVEYPPNCEFEAVTAAAVATCDALDDVENSIISLPELCSFNPLTIVSRPANCRNNSSDLVSNAAAVVANADWYGVPNKQGQRVYTGYSLDTPLKATVDTACHSSGDYLISAILALRVQLFQLCIEKSTTFGIFTTTTESLTDCIYAGYQQWGSFISTNDANLTAFKEVGGKSLSWHGIADDLIPFGGST
ncbi:hypothetical protein AG0111_0g2787 [Alternaria gaisen]|uniref:Uncharacterized protein n=1 Tax=Alternaria gaisen TaxID=167740 RepID=A0ACB6FXI4_9PLEO|nr:hypothetical protein AG0111_0g2787 [Alternaria gaisen]